MRIGRAIQGRAELREPEGPLAALVLRTCTALYNAPGAPLARRAGLTVRVSRFAQFPAPLNAWPGLPEGQPQFPAPLDNPLMNSSRKNTCKELRP